MSKADVASSRLPRRRQRAERSAQLQHSAARLLRYRGRTMCVQLLTSERSSRLYRAVGKCVPHGRQQQTSRKLLSICLFDEEEDFGLLVRALIHLVLLHLHHRSNFLLSLFTLFLFFCYIYLYIIYVYIYTVGLLHFAIIYLVLLVQL